MKRTDPATPGIRRIRAGKGFRYLDPDGRRVRGGVLARIEALVIPPAWEDVWICPDPDGHLQATGVDAAGRTQYLYHDRWKQRQARVKFRQVQQFGAELPELRRRYRRDLRADCLNRDAACATAVALLDAGAFRIGSSASENGTGFGLATIRREHVSVRPPMMVFEYPGKGGVIQRLQVRDQELAPIVARMGARRGGGDELLACQDSDGQWRDIRAEDVNRYISRHTETGATARSFRIWNATLLAAMLLAREDPHAEAEAAIRRVLEQVAGYLGNTVAVTREHYVDPRIPDAFRAGRLVDTNAAPLPAPAEGPPGRWTRFEPALLRVLAESGDPS